jgi:hypothetical protein
LKPQLSARLGGLGVDLLLVSHGTPVLEDGDAALAKALS